MEWPENLVLRISTRSVSSRSAVRACRPVHKNWVAGCGAGGIRVPAIVTAVCVVAAVFALVDGVVVVAGVDVEPALHQLIMMFKVSRSVRSVFLWGYPFRIRWRFRHGFPSFGRL